TASLSRGSLVLRSTQDNRPATGTTLGSIWRTSRVCRLADAQQRSARFDYSEEPTVVRLPTTASGSRWRTRHQRPPAGCCASALRRARPPATLKNDGRALDPRQ